MINDNIIPSTKATVVYFITSIFNFGTVVRCAIPMIIRNHYVAVSTTDLGK